MHSVRLSANYYTLGQEVAIDSRAFGGDNAR
jgi:hypothetical protein